MTSNLDKTKTEMTERLHEYQELLSGMVLYIFAKNSFTEAPTGTETINSPVYVTYTLTLPPHQSQTRSRLRNQHSPKAFGG